MSHLRSRNKNIYQPKTPEWIKTELRANFTTEIDFFEFCKQRLQKQYLAGTNHKVNWMFPQTPLFLHS